MDLKKIQALLRENGYPDRFIQENMMEKESKPLVLTVEKKTLFIKVPFQGDAASELLNRRLNQAVSRAFPAAKVRVLFSRNPVLRCEGYIGRMSRRLSKRIREHLPGEVRSINNAILAHMVDTGHRVGTNKAFKMIYKVPPNYQSPWVSGC